MNEFSSDPVQAFEEDKEFSILSIEILENLRAKINFVDAPDNGVHAVMPSDLLMHVSPDEMERWHELGIHIHAMDEIKSISPLIVGAGNTFPIVEFGKIESVRLIENEFPTGYKPPKKLRSGNNRKHADLNLTKRRKQIADKSKRRNRK